MWESVINMFKDSDFNKKGFSAERECMICRHYGDNKDFCKGCGNCGASDCCRCVGSSDWEEMQREFPDVPYGAEMVPISEDEELYAVYDDAGHHHGFIEMDDDEEDDAIDIDITDEEMNEVAEVRLDSESFNADIGFKCKFCGSTADGLDSWDDDFCSRACEKGLTVCGISDGKGQNGKYGEFCAIQYAGKSDADDNKQIIHIDCPNCEFSEDGWGMSFNEEMKEGYRAESFNAEGRQEQYGSWGSKASAKRQMKKVGLEGWAIKQKGNQWALFRPSKNAETFETRTGFVFPDRKAWPIGDREHAELAIDYMKEGKGNPADYPKIEAAIEKKYGAETINGLPADEYYAEMDLVNDGMVAITNTNDETVGVIEVMDDKDDEEAVEISIQDENLEEIGAFTLDDGMILDNQEDYLAEMKKPSLLALALGVGAVLLGGSLLKDKLVKNADTDIIESPDTGDLSPADYEELVVESTGYAVDIIPMSLDGSFMGSRFSALPTERYVEYNDPGIGAHIDVALNRDEDFLEPEMAMVQAAEGETDIKEAQAPGQSPYLSMDGQEPKDFSYRVLKETHPVSLDPAVVPFIPQSMSGYTGNDNRPPSVYNKMFNLGVLGQTPLFVPGNHDDIGASHTGSRRATPSKMGSIGGPLSDAVNGAYTDGQTSKSLAQWSIENSVQQTSDTEALVIDRSSGNTKRIRRV